PAPRAFPSALLRRPPPRAVVAPRLHDGAGEALEHFAALVEPEGAVVARVDRGVALPAEGRDAVDRRAALPAVQVDDLVLVPRGRRLPLALRQLVRAQRRGLA